MIFSLIGPPCVGKGTQVRLLAESYHIVGAGDLLRNKAKTDPACAAVLASGELVSAEFIWSLIKEQLVINDNRNIVMDGYPRELEQIKLLHQYLKMFDLQIKLIVMTIDERTLLERMIHRTFCDICGETRSEDGMCCGRALVRRSDDNQDAFDRRLAVFDQNISQIKQYALQATAQFQWLELRIACSSSPDLVHRQILELVRR